MLFAATPVVAGDFEDARAAYYAGNYKKTYRLLKPLAEQGHAKAQYNLGVLYARGQGVPQDYIQAHMWRNLAASRQTIPRPRARSRVWHQTLKKRVLPENYYLPGDHEVGEAASSL